MHVVDCLFVLLVLFRRNSLFGIIILFANWSDQDFEWFNFSFGQKSKFGAKEHEMLEARIQMRGHFECFQSPKKGAVDNAVDAKESSKNLSTECGKCGCLKDAQCFFFFIIVWEFGLIIDLFSNPCQYFINIHWSTDTDGDSSSLIGPSIFYSTRKSFSRSKRVQVRIRRHDCPNCRNIIVKVNGMDCHPSSTGFAWRQSDLEQEIDYEDRSIK